MSEKEVDEKLIMIKKQKQTHSFDLKNHMYCISDLHFRIYMFYIIWTYYLTTKQLELV